MNITKFVNLKVCAVAAFSCAATVGVQHWCTSKSPDNASPLIREEQTQLKQSKLETEKVLDELRARQAKIEKDEKAFAEKQSALDEKIAAFEQMRTSGATTVVAKEPDGVVAIEPIGKDPKPAIVKVIHPDPVVPPTDYVPRRPQVFDGGNREPVVPKDTTIGVTRPLYFSDLSSATGDVRYDPSILRRDIPPHLADMPKRRRFTNLQPRHVASFRATKDGWSLETPDGVSNGAYAPATGTERVIDSTAARAPKDHKKDDAAVVTLYGSGDPKSPFDGKSAVSEAERNAFNKERRNFEKQQKDFELKKSKKEKELAEKTKELKDREKFLELREENKDDAADLFDLSERQTRQHAEDLYILREKKEPYEIEKQNEESMTIERQPKPELVCEGCDTVGIDAQEKKSYQKQIITSINLCDKEREKTQIGNIDPINLLSLEKPENEIVFGKALTVLAAYDPEDEKPKEPLSVQKAIELNVRSEPKEAFYSPNTQWTALPGVQLPYVKKRIQDGDWVQLPKPKESLWMQHLGGFAVQSEPKETSYSMSNTRVTAFPGTQPTYYKKRPKMPKFREKMQIKSTNSIKLLSLEKTENQVDFGRGLTVLAAYDPEDEKPKEPLLMQRAITFALRSKPKKNAAERELYVIREEEEESEEEESEKEDPKKVSAFTLDEKPVSENKISKTESIQILKKKEKPLLASTKTVAVEVKATKKQPPKLEISKMQPITAEAQAVETKENATGPQKPELSVTSKTAEVSFEKSTLPKKVFSINEQSKLLVAPKKTEKKDASVGTEPPKFKISEGEKLTAEAKKVEKQYSETETETETLSVITEESSFGYSPKIQAKPLLPQLNDSVSLTGAKSFGELQGGVVTQSMHIPAKPKPTLEIDKQEENLLFEAQPKPESEISSVETLSILRREKPKNQISSEVSVKVLPKPTQAYVKTNSDLLFIKGNDANWYLQVELDATKEELKAEKEASGLLATQLDLKETLQQKGKVMKLNALKPIRAVSESVVRTKNTQNTEVHTADKVTLSTEKNELFIKGEKPSKDWIIDFDEDEAFVSEDTAVEKVKELFQTEYRNLSESVGQLKKSVRFGKPDADETETLAKLRKNQKTLADKMSDFEKTCNNSYSKLIHQFVNQLSEELDAVEAMLQKQKPLLNEPKVAVANKMFKPGWSVLKIQSKTVDDTIGKKFFSNLSSSEGQKICFIGKPAVTANKSAVTTDAGAQAGKPKVFGNLQSENVMNESFVNDKLSLMSRFKQKEKEYENLENEYAELGESAKEMIKLNEEYVSENKGLKSTQKNLEEELVNLRKNYENLEKAFEELKEVEETGCCNVSDECEIKRALKGAREIAAEAMEGIKDGNLRGAKAAELLKRFGEQARCFSNGKGENHINHKCENAVCQQRIKFMNSLAHLLQKMKNIPEADAFVPIQADRWTLKGDASKVSKPFEIISADSFGLDVNPKVKSETEAQKEQLSKLTAENEDLKLQLKEELDRQEALYNIMKKTEDDTEPLEKENNDLKEKLEELEKQNKEKDEKLKKLEKEDKEISDLFYTAYSDNGKLRKELEEKNNEINVQKRQYRMLQEEMNKIRQEKDNEINAQKRENRDLGDENFLLEFENKVLKDRPKNEGDEKKNSKDMKFKKLPKKPTEPNMAKEVDAFLENLQKAGDNLKKLKFLQEELEKKTYLKEWVSDELKEAIKDAKERKDREEKYKKEEEEAKKVMNDLMRQLKNTEDVGQLKKGIVALLDYAQQRLPCAADKFELENAESFVKNIGEAYGNDVERIAQKNAAGSFVHTVSWVQENIMEVWKRITVILKPKALPMKSLSKATADEEKEKINREAERRIQKAVQEKDAEIAALKTQLEQMKRKLKQQVLDAKTRRRHIKGKTETNLSHETDVSPLYNFNDTSDIRNKEKRDGVRRPTRYETPETNKLSNRCANNYSRDSSVSYSQTLLKKSENSDSRLEKYNESQIKSDKTFETVDKKGLLLFTVQGKSSNFLGSIEEMKDEIQEDDKECMWPKLQKAGDQVLYYLNSDYWKNDTTWDNDFGMLNKSAKAAIRRLLDYIEKKNKQTSGFQKSATEKNLKSAKVDSKTRSRLLLPTTATDKLTENKSRLTKNLKSMFDNQKSDGETHYKKIEKTKINRTGRKKDKTE